jgi:hypothetical protein
MHSNLRQAVWLIAVLGCQGRSAPSAVPSRQAAQTVFTDSALHYKLCEPTKPAEDWRKVCTPKDQSAPRAIPKNP